MAEPVYLDHAATTPLAPVARDAWVRAASVVGNPSSAHAAGRAARRVVEEAREQVADALGARPAEVVFTSGGTEADNLAVLGIARARRAADPGRVRVLVSAVEHAAVLEAADKLAAEGFDITRLPVDHDGRVLPASAVRLLSEAPETIALVSCQWTNNETGALQPVAEIAKLARGRGVLVHTDAVQAVAHEPVRFTGLDALSVTAHKLGGPMGVGALLVRTDVPLAPLGFGGGQERAVRSGTVPVALIASFAAALGEAVRVREAERAHLRGLSARLATGLEAIVPGCVVGPSDPAWRSPHIVNAVFPGHRAADLLVLLDQAGVACSAGSACHAGVVRSSHVLAAMGYSPADAASGLRFSFGRTSTAADVDAALAVLPTVLARTGAGA